jgi:zinc/manganese transport system substrate-binding protein
MSTPRLLLIAPTLVLASLLASCRAGDVQVSTSRGDCPVRPISVVVTVDQWGDLVRDLAGDCGRVTTIIQGSSADPHDYEPTPADRARLDDAELVVRNGLGYDHWSDQALAARDHQPVTVDAGEVMGLHVGVNPHLWYDPDAVHRVADAVTHSLEHLLPGAGVELDRHHAAWEASMWTYDREVAGLRRLAAGRSSVATEPVFEYMADALGLHDATPTGYRRAAMNDAEPSPADLAAFDATVADHRADVLLYNVQASDPTSEQLRREAEHHGVPVVDVTETVPPGAHGFVAWQLGQLRSLRTALAHA